MLKKYTLYIIIAIIVSICLNRLYMAKADPGCQFFSQCFDKTEEWEQIIRQKSKNCYVFAGGSEVRMGIDPQTMWDTHNIAAINAGGEAGYGVRCNIQAALKHLTPGDTLLLSQIPGNSNLSNNGTNHTGINFCYTHYGNAMFTDGIIPFNTYSISKLATGNATNLCIHIMRILTRPECIYRYNSPANAKINNGGRVEVFLNQEQNKEQINPQLYKNKDYSNWNTVLQDVKAHCDKNNIQLIAYISRSHSHPSLRRYYAQGALHFTELGIPVLKDPNLGTWPDGSKFSDSSLHLSIEGGKDFSEFIAGQLKAKSYWTKEELQNIINGTE